MKHNTLNESLIVYGNNYLEKRRTTHLLKGHIPPKGILELQDHKSEESPESDHDSEFDDFAKELDSN